MKAYCVYPDVNPNVQGCVLIYAPTRNDAKYLGFKLGPWFGSEYIDFRAIRKPDFDQYYEIGKTLIETNDELPEGVEFFSDVLV